MTLRPPPTITLSEGAGYGAVFGTLGAVLLLTVGFAFTKEKSGDKTKVTFDANDYLAARNSQGVVSMTLSYFVSGMGLWVIFAAPEAAVVGGSIALAGYALSTMFPLLLFGVIAPAMRKNVPRGFTLIEFVRARLGWYNAVYVGLLSLFYMSLYLTAELSSAGSLASGLSLIPRLDNTFWEGDTVTLPQPLGPILGVSLITLAYTGFGGLPVSILTDRIQGVAVFILTLIILIATCAPARCCAPPPASPCRPPLPRSLRTHAHGARTGGAPSLLPPPCCPLVRCPCPSADLSAVTPAPAPSANLSTLRPARTHRLLHHCQPRRLVLGWLGRRPLLRGGRARRPSDLQADRLRQLDRHRHLAHYGRHVRQHVPRGILAARVGGRVG